MTLSWQSIIIGDPKATVVIDNTATIPKIDETAFSVYPNPNNGFFHISGQGLNSIEIFDAMGKQIYFNTSLSPAYHLVNLAHKKGLYVVKLNSDSGTYFKRIVIQ